MVTVSFCGCAAGDQEITSGEPAAEPYSGQHYLWNRGQFELLEVRVHPSESYDGTANLLESPLDPEVGTLVEIPFGSHLTVIREKVADGDLWALTTATPLTLRGGLHVILVFDDGFRTMTPEEASGLTGYIGPRWQEEGASDVVDDLGDTDANP